MPPLLWSRVASHRRAAIAIFAMLLIAVVLSFWCSDVSTTLPEIRGQAPAFTLSTAQNKTLSSSELQGHVWLMNFFFASCPGPCPLISKELENFSKLDWVKKQVHLLSVTVDPENDTPEKLAEYGASFHAIPGSWDFLTGPKDAIRALLEKGFQLIAADDVSVHTTRIVLVDRHGNIRGLYQGTDQESLRQLFKDTALVVQYESKE